jgi:hypothetical protein
MAGGGRMKTKSGVNPTVTQSKPKSSGGEDTDTETPTSTPPQHHHAQRFHPEEDNSDPATSSSRSTSPSSCTDTLNGSQLQSLKKKIHQRKTAEAVRLQKQSSQRHQEHTVMQDAANIANDEQYRASVKLQCAHRSKAAKKRVQAARRQKEQEQEQQERREQEMVGSEKKTEL